MKKSNSKGHLVVFEGGDNVGKSSIIQELVRHLTQRGEFAKVLAFPGNKHGTLGKWVYDYHHDSATAKTDQTSLQLLHVAAHLDCIENEIKPLLEQGSLVILDRFWWSTWVYGVAGGVSEENLTRMISIEKDFWGGIRPSCLFWLRRTQLGLEPFQKRICSEYDRLAERELGNHPVFEIINNSTVDDVLSTVINHLTSLDLMRKE